MADDLRRVCLLFNEEGAVDFKKSLQEINLELNKNYNQFKLTQAQWDNSTKSTEKLRAEQEYLKNAYEIQTDKVNTLKMQLSDLENAENKNTTAIKKKRNELTAAEVKLESYNKKIKDIETQLHNTGKKIEEFGTKVENTGKKIENAGKKMSAFSLATGTALITSAKTAIDFEDAFTGVEKTVDGTAEQMEELKQGIRDMAKEIPSTTTEISAVAEAAGQLGIETGNILDFTRVMIDLGNSTNLSAEEAASSLAKFANVTKMSAKDYDRLGATIVALGNNFATTEADIVEMATRLAATGELAGLSESQILSLATAMSSVGIEAEAGGSAMSKLLKQIQVACETGSDELDDFASVAGVSAKDFKKAFEKDAVSVLSMFISGLNDTERNGKSAIAILDDMGLKEVRLSNTVLSLAYASDVMNKAVQLGNDAWEDNTALTNEANKRYDTLKSKLTMAMNKIKDMAITLGNKLMPSIEKVLDKLGKWIDKFEDLSDEQVDMIVNIGLIVTAIGPLLTAFGKITSTIGGTIKGIGTFTEAIGVATGSITSTKDSVNKLATIMQNLFSPTGLAVTAVVAGVAILVAKTKEATEETRKQAEAAKETAEKIREEKDAIDELRASIDNNVQTELNHIERTENLWEELQKITDENGKIKEGYEERAKVITGDLSNALGTEISITNNVIDKYKDLQEEIDNLILKKKGETILSGSEQKYNEALANREQKTQELIDLEEELAQAIKDEQDAREKYESDDYRWGGEMHADYENWENSKARVKELKKAVSDAQKVVNNYTNDMADYERKYELYAEGTTESIQKMVDETGKTYQKNGETVETTYERQIKAQQIYLKEAKALNEEAIKNNNETQKEMSQTTMDEANKRINTIVEELIKKTSIIENDTDVENAWKQLASESYDVYAEKIKQMPVEMQNTIQGITGVIVTETPNVADTTDGLSDAMIQSLDKNAEAKKMALDMLKNYMLGLSDEDRRRLLKDAGTKNAEEVMKGIAEGDLSEEAGVEILKGLNNGLNNNYWKNQIFGKASSLVGSVSKMLSTITGKNVSLLPGHKDGLDYVPKDNYVARLHKGERVLTAEENKEYTRAEETTKKTNTTVQKEEIDYGKMANAFLTALNSCKLTLDEDGFAKLVKNELYEVI